MASSVGIAQRLVVGRVQQRVLPQPFHTPNMSIPDLAYTTINCSW